MTIMVDSKVAYAKVFIATSEADQEQTLTKGSSAGETSSDNRMRSQGDYEGKLGRAVPGDGTMGKRDKAVAPERSVGRQTHKQPSTEQKHREQDGFVGYDASDEQGNDVYLQRDFSFSQADTSRAQHESSEVEEQEFLQSGPRFVETNGMHMHSTPLQQVELFRGQDEDVSSQGNISRQQQHLRNDTRTSKENNVVLLGELPAAHRNYESSLTFEQENHLAAPSSDTDNEEAATDEELPSTQQPDSSMKRIRYEPIF